MASVTKYPGTVSQSSGGDFRVFSNLGNIKNHNSGSYAASSNYVLAKGESPNRPSTVSCTNFKLNLPVGAEVERVVVTLSHQKVQHSGNVFNVPKPTISLLGVSGFSKRGYAPAWEWTSVDYTFTGAKLTRAVVNGSGFGVKVDYPANVGSDDGKVRIGYVRVRVDYRPASYGLSLKRVSGGYDGDLFTVQATISNKNLVGSNPSLTLSAPAGFSYVSCKGSGVVSVVNGRTLVWNPKLSGKVGSSSMDFTFSTGVTFPSGVDSYTGIFTLVESLLSTTKNFTATVRRKPPSEGEETAGDGQIVITDDDTPYEVIKVTVGEEISSYLNIPYSAKGYSAFAFPVDDDNEVILNEEDTALTYGETPTPLTRYELYHNVYNWMGVTFSDDDINEQVYTITDVGKFAILLYRGDTNWWESYDAPPGPGAEELTPKYKFVFEARPNEETVNSFNPPFLSLLELSDEEINRLGHEYTYIIQSDLKHTTEDTYARDWYKNNRIGVFNNPILDNITITETTDPETGETIETITDSTDYDNLTITEIYENADYWGNTVTNVNEYESLECEFTYNKDYPLYIIITGDYTETEDYGYDMGTITHTEPCIIEKTVYKERLPNGNYPIPIMDLIDYEENDGISTITLQAYQESNPVILYNLPLDQDYGTGTQYAIRGVQINGNIDQTDNLIVYAKLRAPNGMVGQRSIVLQDADYTIDSINTLNIGGLGDLWGFNTLDMTQLEDWELELSTTNLLNNDESTLQISDITITFYIEKIEKQTISVSVEGENLAYYGAFIDTVEIPEGLETDTSFLTIDGTDTNDAYRQNIREKTITLNFNVDSCDLETSAMMLRQVTKLLVNDKDEYNRPIPKIIEFSHYPNSYFEYIIESTLEIETEITGYNVTAKLTIPSGTSYSQENTVTNNIGYVQGLAAINPIITVQPNDEVIQITETVTGQNFNIGYTGNWNNKVVEIDCEDRKVWLLTDEDADDGIDISKYVDMNSDWFRLHGEYQFEATNATIRTITYNERW